MRHFSFRGPYRHWHEQKEELTQFLKLELHESSCIQIRINNCLRK
jgi:hypothetical protein